MIEFKKGGFMDRDNIAIVAKFAFCDYEFCVGNTHILFNPNRGDVKLGQVKCLVEEIEHMSNKGELPVIMCGDFNSTPNSSIVEFIKTGSLDLTVSNKVV